MFERVAARDNFSLHSFACEFAYFVEWRRGPRPGSLDEINAHANLWQGRLASLVLERPIYHLEFVLLRYSTEGQRDGQRVLSGFWKAKRWQAPSSARRPPFCIIDLFCLPNPLSIVYCFLWLLSVPIVPDKILGQINFRARLLREKVGKCDKSMACFQFVRKLRFNWRSGTASRLRFDSFNSLSHFNRKSLYLRKQLGLHGAKEHA